MAYVIPAAFHAKAIVTQGVRVGYVDVDGTGSWMAGVGGLLLELRRDFAMAAQAQHHVMTGTCECRGLPNRTAYRTAAPPFSE